MYVSFIAILQRALFKAWTYLMFCPTEDPKIEWKSFPALNVTVSHLLSFSFL